MKRISIDYENNAEQWWMAAQASDTTPAAFAIILADSVDDITVSDEDAAAIMAWAETLPGWADGPEHAPTALTLHDA
jgi:hypothetical protein